MKIKNRSWSPLVISLGKEKSLTLPARGSKDISTEDFKKPGCQQLLRSRAVVVLPSKSRKAAGSKEGKSSEKKEKAGVK